MTDRELELEIQKQRIKRKKGKFSKRIIIFVITLNVLFAAAILAIFWHTGNEPSALIVAFFGFTTVELWELSKIKRKQKMEGNNDGS